MDHVWLDIKSKSPKTPEHFVNILRTHLPQINSGKVLQWESKVQLRPWEKTICLFLYFYLIEERYQTHEGRLSEQFLKDMRNQIDTLWKEVKDIMDQQSMEDAFAGLQL